MKLKTLLTISIALASHLGYNQTLATNFLFNQALIVYKGTVEEIVYGGSDSEGDDFGIVTSIQKIYKGNFAGEKITVSITKIYEYDSLTYEERKTNEFQVAKGSTYVFFIQSRYGQLLTPFIEGIPYSEELERDLASFNPNIYFGNELGGISFYVMQQSSPINIVGMVKDVDVSTDYYQNAITVVTEQQETVLIKTRDLACICKDGSIQLNRRYLFFLTPVSKRDFILTDRWLGAFELNASLNSWLNLSAEK